MNSRPHQAINEYRYESKVPLLRKELLALRPTLHDLGLYPKKIYPDRPVNSIYLDSLQLNNYFDNIAGISSRRKVRIRWYQDLQDMALEIKSKKNKVSIKTSVPLNNQDSIIPTERRLLKDLMNSNPNCLSPYDTQFLRPTLKICYLRSYFELHPGIRMTVDQKIRYWKLRPKSRYKETVSPVFSVVEFKYLADSGALLRELLREFPFRLTRHSKYVVGINSVGYV